MIVIVIWIVHPTAVVGHVISGVGGLISTPATLHCVAVNVRTVHVTDGMASALFVCVSSSLGGVQRTCDERRLPDEGVAFLSE